MRVRQNVLTDETATVFPRACVIRCLYVTTDNSLWLGSAGQGLGRLKAGRFTQFSTEQGLPDDYLSNILSDNHGRLWFAGNRGIFSVPQKAFDDIDAGKATRVLPMVYGRNDGLQRLQASHDAWPGALRGADGRLMFAMQSGVAVVYPDEIKEEAVPPSAVIERVTVNGKTVAAYGTVGPRLRLAPGQRQVEFSFTAPSLLMPESMGFKYRLHGLDKTWVNSGARRTADYSQLVPGHYQFQVAACNSNGVWNEDAVALELVVEPYWWETTWFRVAGPLVAASLILAGVILFLRRRYTFKIERLELLRATEKERSRIAADLHDEVGSSLTKISRLAAKRDDAEISETARRVVQAMDEIVWTVNPRNDTLDSLAVYLVHYLEDFLRPAGIACEFNVALKGPEVMLSAEMRHNLFLAVKEAVNNAVKHAAPRRVRLGLALHEEALTVTVQDDGCGFMPGAQAVGADGLVNIRQRLAAIGGQVDITSVPGHGTTVTLQVVLNRKAQT
jgi:signal transduction histidine kinase